MRSLLFLLLPVLISLKGEFKVVKWDWMDHYLNEPTQKIRIINFWATWCKPCVEELPYLEEIHRKQDDAKVLLVSLDRASMSSKTEAFLQKKNITAPSVLLDEVDFNRWVNQIDSSWSGAIPATLIITKDGKRFFYEKAFSSKELDSLFQTLNY